MADFNPQVPATNDPNYFRYSEPIKSLEVNKSKGIALSAAGEVGDAAVKLGDQAIKGDINDKVNAFADKERGDFTSALEQLKNGIPQPVQTPQGSKALSFADESTPTQDLPPAITQGLSKLDSLTAAYGQGKVNDTYYSMRLDADVKALRAQYPGYRDYIDQRVSQNTGMDPANAYVKNLMQDINTKLTGKKTEYDKDLDLARGALKSGIPGANEQFNALQNNPDYAPTFRQWFAGENAKLYNIQLQDAIRNNNKGNKAEIADQRKADFTNEVSSVISSNFKSLVTIPGVDTPQGILDTMAKVAAHPEDYTDAQLKSLDTKLMIQKATVMSQLSARASEVKTASDGSTYSYNSDVGADNTKAIIANVAESYDLIHNALSGGGPQGAGAAFFHANQVIAKFADKHDNLVSGPVGEYIKTFKVLSDDMGPTFSSLLIPKLLKENVDQKMMPLFNESAINARAQPDFDGSGKPITLKQHMDAALDLEKQGKITASMRARYTGSLINIVDDIKDKNAPDKDKANVIKYLFSPEGQGILGNIKTDYTDPQTGKFVPGKYSVFSRFTSDDVVKEVARLSKSDPSIGKMYKNYLENEAGSQLFYKELQNLNHFTGHDDLHFAYDSDNHQISLLDKAGKAIPQGSIGGTSVGLPTANPVNNTNPSAGYIFQAQKIVNRINDGLAGLGRVEQGLGGDVNSYLLNFLQRSQVDLGKNWTGLPQKLVDAIAASRSPQRRIEDTFDNLKSK